jgi:hypothetical protein
VTEPKECAGNDENSRNDNQQRRYHAPCRYALRLVFVFDWGKPRQRLFERSLVAHRSTLAFHGRPTTAQLRLIFSIRWQSTSEWAWDVVPTWKR